MASCVFGPKEEVFTRVEAQIAKPANDVYDRYRRLIGVADRIAEYVANKEVPNDELENRIAFFMLEHVTRASDYTSFTLAMIATVKKSARSCEPSVSLR